MDGIYKIETYDKVPQTVTCLFLRFILRVLSGMSREDHDSVSLAFQVWWCFKNEANEFETTKTI